LHIQVLQGSAETDLRWDGRFNTIYLSSRSENTTVKELQEAQLSQGDHTMLRLTEYIAKSLKITQGHSKW